MGGEEDDDAMDWEFQTEVEDRGDESMPEGQPELNISETEPAGLQDRENAFFKDLYSNPNLQKGVFAQPPPPPPPFPGVYRER